MPREDSRRPGETDRSGLATAGQRGGIAAVIARAARAAHPLPDRGTVAAPAGAVFKGREIAPRLHGGALSRGTRRAGAAAVVEVVTHASPAPDPYPVMHAGQSRILRHGGTARHQQQPQRKSADTPEPVLHDHLAPRANSRGDYSG